MVKKVIFALINFLSIAIIAAAVAVLCIVLMTKPGKAPSSHGAPCDDGKHGPHLRGGHPHRCEENRPR